MTPRPDARFIVGIYANTLDREPRLVLPAHDDEQIARQAARAHAERQGTEIVLLTEYTPDGKAAARWEVGADGVRRGL